MRAFTLSLCCLSLLTGVLRAEESSPEPMTVSVQREAVPTLEPIFRAYVTVGTEKFAFLMPEKFSLAGDPAMGRLELKSLESDSLITFSIHGPASMGTVELQPDSYREMAASLHPEGKIINEFKRPVAGRNALGFDIEWKGSSGLVQKTRVLYAPTIAGVAAISLTSGLKNFANAESSLNAVLGTLSPSVNGQLHVTHIADRN